MAELATSFVEAEMDEAYISKEEKVRVQNQMEQVREAWIKYGIDSPEYAALLQNQQQTLKSIFQEQCGRLRRDVRKTEWPEEGKVHALQQISRYQIAVESSQLSTQQETKIGKILHSLPSKQSESDDEPHLTSESLQFFISHIKSEMDKLGIPAAMSGNADLAAGITALTESKVSPALDRPLHKGVDPGRVIELPPPPASTDIKTLGSEVGSLIENIEKDPKVSHREVSKLIEKAKNDPRFSELLKKVQTGGGK